MKKTLLYTLVGAFAIAGLVDAAPLRAETAGGPAPRSLEELRADVRGEAMTSLRLGDLQQVRHTRMHRRRMARQRGVFRSRTMSRIHHRGRSCRGYVNRRCYYTPRLLKPFRQR